MPCLQANRKSNKVVISTHISTSENFILTYERHYMATNNSQIYQFQITLKEIKPKIWRRIQVPSGYNFWDLHVAIQDAMGWQDYHLHQFTIINPKTGKKEFIGIPDDEDFEEIIPGNKAKISKYFVFPKDKANYEYDFGDGWEHEIILEKVLPVIEGSKYPQCIAGERACPPEDCGGIYGYENLLEIIRDPKDKEYKETIEWLGREFDPEDFNSKSVQFDDPKERWKMAFK